MMLICCESSLARHPDFLTPEQRQDLSWETVEVQRLADEAVEARLTCPCFVLRQYIGRHRYYAGLLEFRAGPNTLQDRIAILVRELDVEQDQVEAWKALG